MLRITEAPVAAWIPIFTGMTPPYYYRRSITQGSIEYPELLRSNPPTRAQQSQKVHQQLGAVLVLLEGV
jgi:hypothetical protein